MQNYIYVIGEEQSAIIPENPEVMEFTSTNMGEINTEELLLVIGNVFGKGEFFPGPQEVLTSVIHEVVRRWEEYQQQKDKDKYCVVLTALRLLDGQVEAAPLSIISIGDQHLSETDNDQFYTLLLDQLPGFQEKFKQKAYSPDSKLITIIQDAAEHHELKQAPSA
ncbi:hypothetical protein [Desulfogranum marinum]|uniref:hypothetical protein n=1 Tax=Desulfogranum marinum TaxID=453220 RepID=UPI0019643844|nr:hypothetical protein [Desulfogranum marinum]MBM9512725.1 hypothetical protein [Desulfogranum marinum]